MGTFFRGPLCKALSPSLFGPVLILTPVRARRLSRRGKALAYSGRRRPVAGEAHCRSGSFHPARASVSSGGCSGCSGAAGGPLPAPTAVVRHTRVARQSWPVPEFSVWRRPCGGLLISIQQADYSQRGVRAFGQGCPGGRSPGLGFLDSVGAFRAARRVFLRAWASTQRRRASPCPAGLAMGMVPRAFMRCDAWCRGDGGRVGGHSRRRLRGGCGLVY